jgi:hypothetical protein
VALGERFGTRGLRVVSAAPIGDDPDGVERGNYEGITREEHMGYPCYLDFHSEWSRPNGLSLRPSFMVIGRDGRIAARITAVMVADTPEYQQLVAEVERALTAR